jgi:Organic Anion Transporter Polypeptide (OATP) family
MAQSLIQSAEVMVSHTFHHVTLAVKVNEERLENSVLAIVRACPVSLNLKWFTNLLSITFIFSAPLAASTAVKGMCDDGRCTTQLRIFVAVFAATVFIHSTSEVGGMLLIMRCTDPKDKAMAMGIIQFSIGLLSNIPCPNIYARIIDATCIVWTKICGDNGHCSLYDSDSFRRYFFGEF